MSSSLRMRPTWNSASEMTPVDSRQATNANAAAASAPAAASHQGIRSSSSGRRNASPHMTRPASSTVASGAPSDRCTANAAASGAIQTASPSEVDTTAAPARPRPRSTRSSRIAPQPGATTQTTNAHQTATASRPSSRDVSRPATATASAAGSNREDIGAGVYRRRPAGRHGTLPAVVAALEPIAALGGAAALDTLRGLAGAALAVALAWLAGSAIRPGRPPGERLAWGLAALLAVAWTTLWQPLAGVSWLGQRLPMALLALAAAAVLAAATRGWRQLPAPCWPPLLVTLAALAIVSIPLAWHPSAAAPIPDMVWHEGWIRQLVDGVPEPSGVYAGVPNSYPWLYHAVAAWLELLPGGMVELFWALEVLAVGGLALGTWLLGRQIGLSERAATWSLGFATAAGGLGWLWIHHPVAVVSASRYGRVHGDFVAGPAVTPALANLPAILPRDLAIALFPLALWFGVRADHRRRGARCRRGRRHAGRAGLDRAGGGGGGDRLPGRAGGSPPPGPGAGGGGGGAALLAIAPWAGRLAYEYASLGGFGPRTALPSVTGPQALVALGVVGPLGIAGVVAIARSRPPRLDRELLAVLLSVTAVLCLVSWLLPGHTLAGVAAVARLQRYLPFLAVALAFPAGWAADAGLARLGSRTAPAAAAALVAAAAASTLLTAIALADNFQRGTKLGLRCDHGMPMHGGQVAAVAGLDVSGTLQVDDAVFRSSGAWVLWRTPPAQLRFRHALDGLPGQGTRAAQTHAIAASGTVPAGVDWVLLPAATAPPAGLERVASCVAGASHHRPLRVDVYRPRSSG